MRVCSLLLAAFLLFPLTAVPQQSTKPYPPGLREADQAVRNGSRLEPPMVTPERKINPAKLQREADDLKTLAATVQEQVGLAAKGEMPAQLPANLKKIAKLTHQLRLDVSR